MVTLTLWGAQTWLTAGVPPSNNCRAFLHSHLSLHWWSFLKPPQCHKSCWELLSALSSRQQATEQGFPCPLQQEAPEAAPGAARCPQIGSRYLVKPCGAGWVCAVRQTPRAPAPSPQLHLSQRAGHWAPELATSFQALTFTESWAWGWGGGRYSRSCSQGGSVCVQSPCVGCIQSLILHPWTVT